MLTNQENKRRAQNSKYLTAINHRKLYDGNLLSIVMKLVEPKEEERLDALGAFHFLEEFE